MRRMLIYCRRMLALLGGAAALVLSSISMAEDSAPEAALKAAFKAAFIFNFTKFVDWPPSVPPNQLRLCTVGVSAVTEALNTFDGKQTMGRTLALQATAKNPNLALCQLVYLTDTNSPKHVTDVLTELKGRPILTVSDNADFLNMGGMIAITRTADRLRFEVDLPSIQNAELKIAAPLLRMAKTVRQ